ncbi:hypothetical protein HDV00_000780 [Rhizophlyctis rosea]|nr:hypothetical protein HDV00_000780 [Rhizophlyctis rosea]
MKYVHLGCLTEWRIRSRNRHSFFECDHCHYRYNFQRTTWAKFVMNEAAVTLMTLLIFLLTATLGGFLMKLFLIFVWTSSEEDDLLFLNPATISFWRIDLAHFLSGVMFIGFLGFFQLIVSVVSGPLGFPRRGWFRGGRDQNMVGAVVFGIMVAIGVARATYAIYEVVKVRICFCLL